MREPWAESPHLGKENLLKSSETRGHRQKLISPQHRYFTIKRLKCTEKLKQFYG